MENKEEIKIEDWEFIEPIEIVKAIDETMKMVENAKLSNEALKEQVYNILFMVRQNTMYITGFIKLLGKGKVEDIMKNTQGLYS